MYSSLPNCNQKRIDYVIKYFLPLDEDPNKNIKKETFINLFLDELSKDSIEVYKLEIKTKQKKHFFGLIHCPLERLLVQADKIKFEMQLKNVFVNFLKLFNNFFYLLRLQDDSIDFKYETETEFPFAKYLKKIYKTLKKTKENEISSSCNLFTKFDRSFKSNFFGVDEIDLAPWLFTDSTRSLLVDNILNDIEFCYQDSHMNGVKKAEEEKVIAAHSDKAQMYRGVEFMLHEEYFEETFILHDETSHHISFQQILEHSNLLFKNDEDMNKV